MVGSSLSPARTYDNSSWNDVQSIVVALFVYYADEDMEFSCLTSSLRYVSGDLVFPPKIRYTANAKLQNRRRSCNPKPPEVNQGYEEIFQPNTFIDQIFERKKSFDMSRKKGSTDDVSVDESLNLEHLTIVRAKGTELSPPAKLHQLIASSQHNDLNPLGIGVVVGDNLCVTDTGGYYSNWMRITYLLASPKDYAKVDLKIYKPSANGSSYLKLVHPATSHAIYEDFRHVESKLEVLRILSNHDNNNYEAAQVLERMKKMELEIGRTKSHQVKEKIMSLPEDKSTGKPYTCHNLYWQGKTFKDTNLPDAGYLRKYQAFVKVKESEIEGWGDPRGDQDTRPWPTYRFYAAWFIPISGSAQGAKIADASQEAEVKSAAEMKLMADRIFQMSTGLANLGVDEDHELEHAQDQFELERRQQLHQEEELERQRQEEELERQRQEEELERQRQEEELEQHQQQDQQQAADNVFEMEHINVRDDTKQKRVGPKVISRKLTTQKLSDSMARAIHTIRQDKKDRAVWTKRMHNIHAAAAAIAAAAEAEIEEHVHDEEKDSDEEEDLDEGFRVEMDEMMAGFSADRK